MPTLHILAGMGHVSIDVPSLDTPFAEVVAKARAAPSGRNAGRDPILRRPVQARRKLPLLDWKSASMSLAAAFPVQIALEESRSLRELGLACVWRNARCVRALCASHPGVRPPFQQRRVPAARSGREEAGRRRHASGHGGGFSRPAGRAARPGAPPQWAHAWPRHLFSRKKGPTPAGARPNRVQRRHAPPCVGAPALRAAALLHPAPRVAPRAVRQLRAAARPACAPGLRQRPAPLLAAALYPWEGCRH